MELTRRAAIGCLVTFAAFALVVPLAFAAGPFSKNLQLWSTGTSVHALEVFSIPMDTPSHRAAPVLQGMRQQPSALKRSGRSNNSRLRTVCPKRDSLVR
jgi:hypothetical protein